MNTISKYISVSLAIIAFAVISNYLHWKALVSLHNNGVEQNGVIVSLSRATGFPHNKVYKVQTMGVEYDIYALFLDKHYYQQKVNILVDTKNVSNSIFGVKKNRPIDYFFDVHGGYLCALFIGLSFFAVIDLLKLVVAAIRLREKP